MITEVSVVVPHYGDAAPTKELVSTLLRQKGTERVQIIVVDDCSPIPFPVGEGYELVSRSSNGGYGAACNSGAARAAFSQILFLNSDLEIEEDFLAHLMRTASLWQPAVVSPAISEPRGPNHVPRKFPKASHHTVEWLVPLARFQSQTWRHRLIGHDVEAFAADRAVVTDWVAGAAHMMPTADFRSVGGFDEGYYMYCEETDLHRRLKEAGGVRCVYLPEVHARHASGGSTDPSRRMGWLVNSRYRYAHKWGGERRLHVGLMTATWINWIWNWLRRLRGVDIEPNLVLRQQLDLLSHGWRGRNR